ncbi:hypothetical protein TanjilG_20394 [Lupinus angustifolius]|uniref:Uncharacterized protein n=1 Tax=Lupinus angustifolius TaxID=3871 RepID=A0A4P1RVN4_LUPAN|nr:hypothetical protein TanjilG_20394 [Lupinus angustifolius]
MAIKLGHILDLYTTNNIISRYAKCSQLSLAHHLFDEMPHRNTVSWNTIISGYVNSRDIHSSMEFVKAMTSALLHMYAKCGRVDDTFIVFWSMPEYNYVSWNALISGYSQVGDDVSAAPSTTSPATVSSRSMMKFESGYNVETVFDGSKLGIEPYAVEVLPNGELLILDSANSNVYRISSSLSLWVTTIAGGKWSRVGGHVDGPSEEAKFSNDFDVVYVGSSCSLLVIDRGNRATREIQLHFDDRAYQYGSGFSLGKLNHPRFSVEVLLSVDIPHTPRTLPRIMTVPGIISYLDGYGCNDGESDISSIGCRERKIIVANMLPNLGYCFDASVLMRIQFYLIRDEILRGLLNSDLIGFHTFDYARHFLSCCSRMVGLDYESKLESVLNLPRTAAKLKEVQEDFKGKKVILGVDDMDIFKGISLKFLALEQLLQQKPDLQGKVVLVQIVNPARGSRKDVQEAMKETYLISQRINDIYGSNNYQPVILNDRPVPRFEKTAYYAVAECCIVNAVRDGMNLVPYIYIVYRQGTAKMDLALERKSDSPRSSMLVVSEFIGCSPSLSRAIRVNPWDVDAVADALYSAITMCDSEKHLHHEKHYRYVSSHDMAYWARSFMQDLERACKDHYTKRCWGIGLGLGFRVVSLSHGFRKLSIDHIVSAYKRTNKRAIFLDYDGTIVPESSLNKAISANVISVLNALCNDTKNIVFIVSGMGRDSLSNWFTSCKMLGLATEHGYFLRWNRDSEWETSYLSMELDWKNMVEPVMQSYTEATDGSSIEVKESALVWHHLDADPDFGSCQAKELLDHLESVLANEPAAVKRGQHIVEVKPQGINKGLVAEKILSTMVNGDNSLDFVMCIGDDRSDEDMFESILRTVSCPSLLAAPEIFACTIGSKPSKAKYYLNDTTDVIKLLQGLATSSNPKPRHLAHFQMWFLENVFSSSALLHMYAKCGRVDDAFVVFWCLPECNYVSWNALISGYSQIGDHGMALHLLKCMEMEGFLIDDGTVSPLLTLLDDVEFYRLAMQLHCKAVKHGLKSFNTICNAMITAYSECGSLLDAKRVFNGAVVCHDLVTWNSMLAAYLMHDKKDLAFKVFIDMQKFGFEPDIYTYTGVVSACYAPEHKSHGKTLHGLVIKRGLENSVEVSNALISMYLKLNNRCMEDALKIFYAMSLIDCCTWNTILAGYSQVGLNEDALRLFVQMRSLVIETDHYTCSAVIRSCSDLATLQLEDARRSFEATSKDNAILWNSIIFGYAQHGQGNFALELFHLMIERKSPWSLILVLHREWSATLVPLTSTVVPGHLDEAKALVETMPFEPGTMVLKTLLGACRMCGDIELASDVAKTLLELEPEEHCTYVILSDMYGRQKMWNEKASVTRLMRERGVKKVHGCSWIEVKNKVHAFNAEDHSHPQCDEIYMVLEQLKIVTVSWNALIAGYSQVGDRGMALHLLKCMEMEGFLVEDGTISPLLMLLDDIEFYSHNGLLEEGCNFIESMESDFGITPRMEHYACVVDIYGRVGHLDEAKALVETMPFEPNTMVLKTLLGACRMCGDIELASDVAKTLLELEPEEHCTYVILSDMYGRQKMWNEKASVTRLMRERGVK